MSESPRVEKAVVEWRVRSRAAIPGPRRIVAEGCKRVSYELWWCVGSTKGGRWRGKVVGHLVSIPSSVEIWSRVREEKWSVREMLPPQTSLLALCFFSSSTTNSCDDACWRSLSK